MHKWLVVLGLLLVAAPIVSGQPNQTPGGKREPAKQSQRSVIPANGPDQQSHGQADLTKLGGDAPARDTAPERPKVWWVDSEWWLVLIAGLTGCVIGWQSWETRAAARGAQVAADAAFLNARAFINAERPWISVKVEPSERKHGYKIVATNKGRTPAALISHAENRILMGVFELPPDVAVYGKPGNLPRIILPEESVVLLEISEYSFVGRDEGKIAQFRNGDAEGYVFGTITYRDLLGSAADKPHETRWAFHVLSWQAGELLLFDYTAGTDEYSIHT
jgi:hypothetical protein